ncbi:MAG: arsenite methyltransferase [Myxococcota bacterium]|jgi:SAM-dependent methyltransferase|nr:arsenite methyltransferase [Myxococcota bacterium]
MTTTTPNTPEAVHDLVRESYAEVVTRKTSCCEPSTSVDSRAISQKLGYTEETLNAVPDEANLGLGCGNPTALASLRPGEVVVDLGAGAGLDALIAAEAVGPEGRVIGVDMTPQMLASARKHAVDMGVHGFVEFREGLIENMPIPDETADVVISNCVINLSPDKPTAFREAFRVLKSGGRLAVSDIVLDTALPEEVLGLAEAYVACIAGAATETEYFGAIADAGFVGIETTRTPAGAIFLGDFTDPMIKVAAKTMGEARLKALADTVWSYKITARKP